MSAASREATGGGGLTGCRARASGRARKLHRLGGGQSKETSIAIASGAAARAEGERSAVSPPAPMLTRRPRGSGISRCASGDWPASRLAGAAPSARGATDSRGLGPRRTPNRRRVRREHPLGPQQRNDHRRRQDQRAHDRPLCQLPDQFCLGRLYGTGITPDLMGHRPTGAETRLTFGRANRHCRPGVREYQPGGPATGIQFSKWPPGFV
jgi:hypothetical protein